MAITSPNHRKIHFPRVRLPLNLVMILSLSNGMPNKMRPIERGNPSVEPRIKAKKISTTPQVISKMPKIFFHIVAS